MLADIRNGLLYSLPRILHAAVKERIHSNVDDDDNVVPPKDYYDKMQKMKQQIERFERLTSAELYIQYQAEYSAALASAIAASGTHRAQRESLTRVLTRVSQLDTSGLSSTLSDVIENLKRRLKSEIDTTERANARETSLVVLDLQTWIRDRRTRMEEMLRYYLTEQAAADSRVKDETTLVNELKTFISNCGIV